MARLTRARPIIQRRPSSSIHRLLLAALLSIQATLISCFRAHHPRSILSRLHRDEHTSSSTSLYNSNSNNQLPFFAAPASFAASSSSIPSTPQSSTVTLRLPLGTLFDGRDYIFVTYTNVRGYEWSVKEVNVLVEDLMDASLGSLGGELRGGSPTPSQQQSLTTDFELSQICLVPTSDWDAATLGLGNRYDVYDGQQRLVTLNLLLAALRDSFVKEAREVNGGKRGVALEATANEISGMLKPDRVRKEDVLRITLRKRDNVLLEKILSPNNDCDGKDAENEEEEEMGIKAEKQPAMIDFGKDNTPTEYLSKLTSKEKSEMLAPLSSANARIVENFLHIADRLSLLSTRERLRLLDYIVERVHLLVCIPETSRIARNIVMSQGRKGMDNEAIDDFKGLVCFRYTLEEKDMYQTFDRWDTLAAEPTVEINGDTAPSSTDESSSSSSSSIIPVGRDTIAAACLLRASASLRTKIRSGGGDEVYEWERWLRHVLWVQNQKLAEGQGKGDITGTEQSWQGKDFMTQEIEPASIALYRFRNGQWDDFNFMSKKMTKEKKNTIISQLTFLKDIIAAAASAKEAEILVLEWLLRAQAHAESDENKLLSRDLDEFLPLIERWSLWMALTRPSPMQRHTLVFELLDAMEGNDTRGAIDASASDLTSSIKEAMDEYKFGASASGKRLAAAILGRMNSHLIIKDGSNVAPDLDKTADPILPEKIPKGSEWEKTWSEEQHEKWVHSLGNLALFSKKGGKRKKGIDGKSSSWEEISKAFKKESWPMTRTLAESDSWDVETAKENQQRALSMMELIWMK